MSDYVPLSVRYGNRRKRLGWRWKLLKERFALGLAPWLTPRKESPTEYVGPESSEPIHALAELAIRDITRKRWWEPR